MLRNAVTSRGQDLYAQQHQKQQAQPSSPFMGRMMHRGMHHAQADPPLPGMVGMPSNTSTAAPQYPPVPYTAAQNEAKHAEVEDDAASDESPQFTTAQELLMRVMRQKDQQRK